MMMMVVVIIVSAINIAAENFKMMRIEMVKSFCYYKCLAS